MLLPVQSKSLVNAMDSGLVNVKLIRFSLTLELDFQLNIVNFNAETFLNNVIAYRQTKCCKNNCINTGTHRLVDSPSLKYFE